VAEALGLWMSWFPQYYSTLVPFEILLWVWKRRIIVKIWYQKLNFFNLREREVVASEELSWLKADKALKILQGVIEKARIAILWCRVINRVSEKPSVNEEEEIIS
jgi:hypothetical protein